MSLTKVLNSKSNIKQNSRADLPVIPRQPVINRSVSESTANQTIINLGFSIDTVNNPDVFMLSVDGKLLTQGALNDYQFTSIDSFGMSSQVTLNFSLTAGLNIQSIKLGLKKETEFLQDARFNDVYESQDQGLQGFVRTSDQMTATTATGAPANGLFHSSITNRASITDLTKDLKARMGIDRIQVQNIIRLPNEFGPNGEPIYSALNDDRGQIRFVGFWANNLSVNGQSANTSTLNDYVEITFYGTGLNTLVVGLDSSRDIRQTTNGGIESANLISTSAAHASVLQNRNYVPNVVLPVVSGLALGVHTVKLRIAAAVSTSISGFEVLNESSSLKIQPGISYLGGKKLSALAQVSTAYNSTFESGTLGTRGGRVVVYQKSDGTIAKAVRPVNAAQANLTSADHTNEEISREFYWREFGSGRADDFSLFATSALTVLAFTLDDGNATLNTNAAYWAPASPSILSIGTGSATGFITITFVGTGLDIKISSGTSAAGNAGINYVVDGTSINSGGALYALDANIRTVKVVSGLPYGTHTVTLSKVLSPTVDFAIYQYVVYQPKKPAIPSGAIELADYNIMADFVANTVAGQETISTGILRKHVTRDLTYVNGTGGANWTFDSSVPTVWIGGWVIASSHANSYIEYTFFGTGFDLRFDTQANRATAVQALLQNLTTNGSLVNLTTTNFPTIQSSVYGAGVAFAPTTGIFNQNNAATVAGAGLRISNLPLALYKVRFNNNNAATFLVASTIDIITPIHSAKSNLIADLQNTLLVGSCAISDNRKFSAIKEVLPSQKAWAQAFGIASTPTTTSTVAVPAPDMSTVIRVSGNSIRVSYSMVMTVSGANLTHYAQIFVNGLPVGNEKNSQELNGGGGYRRIVSDVLVVPVSPGTHKVDVYWRVSGSTGSLDGIARTLLVEER